MLLKKSYFLYYLLAMQFVTSILLFIFVPSLGAEALILPFAGWWAFLLVFGVGPLLGYEGNPGIGALVVAAFGAWVWFFFFSLYKTIRRQPIERWVAVLLIVALLAFMVGCTAWMTAFDRSF